MNQKIEQTEQNFNAVYAAIDAALKSGAYGFEIADIAITSIKALKEDLMELNQFRSQKQADDEKEAGVETATDKSQPETKEE